MNQDTHSRQEIPINSQQRLASTQNFWELCTPQYCDYCFDGNHNTFLHHTVRMETLREAIASKNCQLWLPNRSKRSNQRKGTRWNPEKVNLCRHELFMGLCRFLLLFLRTCSHPKGDLHMISWGHRAWRSKIWWVVYLGTSRLASY